MKSSSEKMYDTGKKGFRLLLILKLLELEEAIMSALTTYIDQLATKIDALKASNDALTAAAVEKDIQITAIQTQLATAQANAFDPADVQKLQDMLAKLA
jgi:hypothetical protein